MDDVGDLAHRLADALRREREKKEMNDVLRAEYERLRARDRAELKSQGFPSKEVKGDTESG